MDQAMERAIWRSGSLRAAMVRADALLEAYRAADAAVTSSGATVDELVATATEGSDKVIVTQAARAEAYMSCYLGLLYGIVERWREWKFADPDVERLIADPRTKRLRDFRHTVFHVTDFDDPRVTSFIQEPGVGRWAIELSNALRRSLRKWDENLEGMVREYLLQELDGADGSAPPSTSRPAG